MKGTIMEYYRIKGRNVVHLQHALHACHYYKRNENGLYRPTVYAKKPRDCSVCDACQSAMKRINKAARMAAKAK